VRRAPDPPGDPATEAQAAPGDDRRLAADRREQAAVAVLERRRRSATFDARRDGARDVTALLLRHRRDAGLRRAVRVLRERRIADHPDILEAWRPQLRRHRHAARAIRSDAKPACRW
jgi:hypothetical protein